MKDENERIPHQIIIDTPGMTSVVTKEYFVIPFTDILINRDFFVLWSIFLTIFTTSATLVAVYTDWWQILLLFVLNLLYIQYWPVGWGGTFILIGILYFAYSRKHKKKSARAQKLQYYRGGR